METIETRMNGKVNNFDIMRFLAAILVIFSHSYPLSGNNHLEPLAYFTDSQITFGRLAVLIFFVISGFLITQSLDKNNNIVYFIKGRVLRIFPALIIVVVLSSFLLGPIVTTLPLNEYFTSDDTYNYLKTFSLNIILYKLPGVFTNNPLPLEVNGSLWTIPIEFRFYFVILIFSIFKTLNRYFMIGIFIFSLIFPFTNFPIYENYKDLFRYFVAGSMFYLYRDKIYLNSKFAFVSFSLIIVSLSFTHFDTVFVIFGSYLILYLAYNPNIKLHNFSKFGDASYGIYIYAFPVQQLITFYFNGNISPFLNFAIALPISIILGYLSWHFIEKHMLKLKYKKIFINFKKEKRQVF